MDRRLIAVAISLVLAKVLVQAGGELAAKDIVDQRKAEIVGMIAGYRWLERTDDRLSGARLVYQIYRGGRHRAVRVVDGSGNIAGAISGPITEEILSLFGNLFQVGVAHNDQRRPSRSINPLEKLLQVLACQGRRRGFRAQNVVSVAAILGEHQTGY